MSEIEPEGTYRPQFHLRNRRLARLLDRFPRLKNWGADRVRSLIGSVVDPQMVATERVIEYPFVFEHLGSPSGPVLDIGSFGTRLPIALASRGHAVVALDFNAYPYPHPNLGRIRADMMRAPFADGTFDAVIAISVVEHIGIGHYGDPAAGRGDLRAVHEIRRLLRIGGGALITVPFGLPLVDDSKRVYGPDDLRELISPLEAEHVEFACAHGGAWRPCPESEAAAVDWGGLDRSVAMVVGRAVEAR